MAFLAARSILPSAHQSGWPFATALWRLQQCVLRCRLPSPMPLNQSWVCGCRRRMWGWMPSRRVAPRVDLCGGDRAARWCDETKWVLGKAAAKRHALPPTAPGVTGCVRARACDAPRLPSLSCAHRAPRRAWWCAHALFGRAKPFVHHCSCSCSSLRRLRHAHWHAHCSQLRPTHPPTPTHHTTQNTHSPRPPPLPRRCRHLSANAEHLIHPVVR